MPEIIHQILKVDQGILRLRQRMAFLRDKQRRMETRIKIELGGLVFTAGMDAFLLDLFDRDGEARAIILGVLAEAADKLDEPQFRAAMLARGRHVFLLKKRAKERQGGD